MRYGSRLIERELLCFFFGIDELHCDALAYRLCATRWSRRPLMPGSVLPADVCAIVQSMLVSALNSPAAARLDPAMTSPGIADQLIYYPTYGVHNPPWCSPCACPDCLYAREPGEPSDPYFPLYWSAKWTMYRVYGGYKDFPPPYDGAPPKGCQYEVSYGATFYDSTWVGPNGEQGAMMEHYEDRSLPIFPMGNHFTSSFISLGDMAYFLTYDKDRPKGMPPICLFSNLNHPPKRDFIKHLPYSKGDSDRLGGKIQGYSFWASMQDNQPPIQTGASPDRTGDGILFGYAFNSQWEPDAHDHTAAPYRHPHSFYFSGVNTDPPDAPIVSQFYTEFAMIRPNPAETWDLVAKFADGKPVPACHLYDAANDPKSAAGEKRAWAGKIRPRLA